MRINTDSVPAMLTPGEGVINRYAMSLPGVKQFVQKQNSKGNRIGQKVENNMIRHYDVGGIVNAGQDANRQRITGNPGQGTSGGLMTSGQPWTTNPQLLGNEGGVNLGSGPYTGWTPPPRQGPQPFQSPSMRPMPPAFVPPHQWNPPPVMPLPGVNPPGYQSGAGGAPPGFFPVLGSAPRMFPTQLNNGMVTQPPQAYYKGTNYVVPQWTPPDMRQPQFRGMMLGRQLPQENPPKIHNPKISSVPIKFSPK